MNGVKKKNLRLCEKLKHLNVLKVGQDVRLFDKDKRAKVKPKSKKGTQNTFSMITFYQSIPSKYQANILSLTHKFTNINLICRL